MSEVGTSHYDDDPWTRTGRRLLGQVITVLAVVVFATTSASTVVAACWPPPVLAAVSEPFREPACRWCAGHRGVSYGTAPGTEVRAVAAGRVTFSGSVVGTGYVVVEVGNGRRVTYGGLAVRSVRAGEAVAAGQALGSTASTLYLGVRVGESYLDPAPLIGRVSGRTRLVPTDGRPGPASPPIVRCGGATGSPSR